MNDRHSMPWIPILVEEGLLIRLNCTTETPPKIISEDGATAAREKQQHQRTQCGVFHGPGDRKKKWWMIDFQQSYGIPILVDRPSLFL